MCYIYLIVFKLIGLFLIQTLLIYVNFFLKNSYFSLSITKLKPY